MDKLQVPRNLNVHELEKFVPSTDVKGFHKDKVHFVCQSIYRGMETLEDNYIHPDKTRQYFVPLHSKVLGKAIGTNNYKALMLWMEAAKIIIRDGSWHDTQVSQGYRLADKYLFSEMVWKPVKYWFLKKKEIADCFDHELYFQKAVVKGLKKWFKTNKLTINAREAYKINNAQLAVDIKKAQGKSAEIKKARLDADANRRKISAMVRGGYLFEQDRFGYRLHTAITQLPKKFRKLVTYDGESMVEVDISCSQLFFSNFIMTELHWMSPKKKTRNKNLQMIWDGVTIIKNKYNNEYTTSVMCLKSFENSDSKGFGVSYFQKKTCQGTLYESIVDKLDSEHLLDEFHSYEEKRKHVKNILLQQLYADPRKRKHKGLYIGENKLVWDCLRVLYPRETELFELAKKAYYKDLCMLLQRIEATAILGYVCKRLLKEHPAVPIFTLHDCLVTTAGNEFLIRQIMEEEINQFMGMVPGMKIKEWN